MQFKFPKTDNEWYNFLCGYHAGLKLKDLTGPELDTSIVLTPIGVGGWGTIGLALPELLYDGITNTGVIPVFTHDVDIDYSGFSCNIQWDSSRLKFNGVTAGDFGSIGTLQDNTDIRYSYSNGNFRAIGLRNKDVVFTEPVVLFFINVTIIDTVTKDTPILLKLSSNSFTDTNYTTLLKWVEIAPGEWYNYFITPLKNISGKIYSNIDSSGGSDTSTGNDNTESAIGDDKIISASASASGVYIGTAYTAPGEHGVVPIYSNSNTKDNFPYSGVHCKLVIEDKDIIFSYLNVVGVGGFTTEVKQRVLDNGYLELDIVATRAVAKIDSITFCYIEYIISNKHGSYIIPLTNVVSELIN